MGLHAKRNETGVFHGVTGKASRPAPPYTVRNRKDPFNINGLSGAKSEWRQFFPTIGYHLRPYKPVQIDLALLATRRSSYRFYSFSIWICHRLKCLTKKCLTCTRGVDRAVAFSAAPITQAIRWITYFIDRLRGTARPCWRLRFLTPTCVNIFNLIGLWS